MPVFFFHATHQKILQSAELVRLAQERLLSRIGSAASSCAVVDCTPGLTGLATFFSFATSHWSRALLLRSFKAARHVGFCNQSLQLLNKASHSATALTPYRHLFCSPLKARGRRRARARRSSGRWRCCTRSFGRGGGFWRFERSRRAAAASGRIGARKAERSLETSGVGNGSPR